jgi:hypothetical protein
MLFGPVSSIPRSRYRRGPSIPRKNVKKDEWARLARQTDQARIAFIQTDIEVAMTFTRIAEMQATLGNGEHFRRLLRSLTRAEHITGKFISQERDVKQQERLRRRHRELSATIVALESGQIVRESTRPRDTASTSSQIGTSPVNL